MDSLSLTEMLFSPLTPFFGAVLVLTGLYSLTVNAADAKQRNHRRAARVALAGGCLYIVGGAIIMFVRLFF